MTKALQTALAALTIVPAPAVTTGRGPQEFCCRGHYLGACTRGTILQPITSNST